MRRLLLTLSVIALLTAAACDRAPTADGLKEWTAADHDGEKRTTPAPNQGPRTTGSAAGDPNALVVDATWKNQCATCHGQTGHGDGPQGQMFRAANLADEDFQAKITDQQMATSIHDGKNRMPKFDQLPDPVIKGLVGRVRSFRGK